MSTMTLADTGPDTGDTRSHCPDTHLKSFRTGI
jgi:hypothetical protein